MARNDSLTPLSPKAQKPGLGTLRQMAPYLAAYKGRILGALAALAVSGLTFVSIPTGLRFVVDRGFSAGNPEMLNRMLGYLLVAIIILAASSYARYSLVAWLGERVVADMRRSLYNHILKLSPFFFETARSGDILSRLSADTAILQTVSSSLSMALRNIVMMIGGIGMMLLTSAKLTGFVLIGIPVVVAPIVIFGRRVRRLSKTNQERHADVSAAAEETVHGIRTVQAFTHEAISRQGFNAQIESAMDAAQQHIRLRAKLVAMVIFLVLSAIGIVLWIGGHDVLDGAITPGQLLAFVGYATLTAASTMTLSEIMGEMNRAAGAAERIFELLDIEPSIKAPALPVAMPAPRGLLEFEQVTFAYPARPEINALQNISFTVQPGERVAIVGPSGAGKTTLYQLALRFYDPQSGLVKLDGVDVKTADPSAVRARTGIVPQDPVIFSTTARENIAYGRPDATADEVIAAAKAAHAHEFVSALPHGYETYLGEKGVRISGGQKQRLAIARAILRNPSLLLLDEATSALDAESERLVQDALEKLMQGRTTLIIAHRLATVMNADRILVMDRGQIVASGTHQSLIAAGGLYARLASLQFDTMDKAG